MSRTVRYLFDDSLVDAAIINKYRSLENAFEPAHLLLVRVARAYEEAVDRYGPDSLAALIQSQRVKATWSYHNADDQCALTQIKRWELLGEDPWPLIPASQRQTIRAMMSQDSPSCWTLLDPREKKLPNHLCEATAKASTFRFARAQVPESSLQAAQLSRMEALARSGQALSENEVTLQQIRRAFPAFQWQDRHPLPVTAESMPRLGRAFERRKDACRPLRLEHYGKPLLGLVVEKHTPLGPVRLFGFIEIHTEIEPRLPPLELGPAEPRAVEEEKKELLVWAEPVFGPEADVPPPEDGLLEDISAQQWTLRTWYHDCVLGEGHPTRQGGGRGSQYYASPEDFRRDLDRVLLYIHDDLGRQPTKANVAPLMKRMSEKTLYRHCSHMKAPLPHEFRTHLQRLLDERKKERARAAQELVPRA